MLPGETPVWAEVENTTEWRPCFFQDAKEYLSFLHRERLKGKEYDDTLRSKAQSILAKSTLSPEENFDPSEYAEDTQLQDTFLHLVSWRDNTIIREIVKRSIGTEVDYMEIITKEREIGEQGLEGILAYFNDDGENPFDLFKFVLMQGRREELIQDFAIDEFGHDYYGDDLKNRYKKKLFGNYDQFTDYLNLAIPYLDENLGLVPDIQQHLYGDPGEPKKMAQISLKFFIYLHQVFKGKPDDIASAIQKLGIPVDEDAVEPTSITPQNLMFFTEYIGKYFSNMNHTHLRD